MRFRGRSRGRTPERADLLEAMFLLVTPDAAHEPRGWVVTDEDEEVGVITVKDGEGRMVLPAFTSEQALLRWRPGGGRFIGVPARVVLGWLVSSEWDRIVVDNRDPGAFAISRVDAMRLLGTTEVKVSAGSMVAFGLPAEPIPDRFLEALRAACNNEPSIVEAYVFQVQLPGPSEAPHLAIGLTLSERIDADAAQLTHALGQEVNPDSWGYEYVDFLVLTPDTRTTVRNITSPAFIRG